MEMHDAVQDHMCWKDKEEYYSSQIQELCKQINKKNRREIIQSEDEKYRRMHPML